MLTYTKMTNKIILFIFSGLVLTSYAYCLTTSIDKLECVHFGEGYPMPWGPKFCNWTTSNKTAWQWGPKYNQTYLTIGRNISFDGIRPTEVLAGQSIYVTQDSGPTADLLSAVLPWKDSHDCFYFKYYIYGEGAEKIQLDLIPTGNDSTPQKLWSRQYSAGDIWHMQLVTIPPQKKEYQIKFTMSPGSGIVGLSFFSVQYDYCDVAWYGCNFEGGDCGLKSINYVRYPDYKFKLSQANSTAELENQEDHTTESGQGHYLDLSGGKEKEMAAVFGLTYGYEGWWCFEFWWWMENTSANRLAVSTQDANVLPFPKEHWLSNGTFPNRTWHRANLEMWFYHYTNSYFSVTHLVNHSSPVKIDDVVIYPRKCGVPITCDFNVNMCGWKRDLSVDWVWDYGVGRVQNSKVLPKNITKAPTDGTARRLDEGQYMYTDFTLLEPGKTAVANMISDFVPATNGSCLEFAHYPLNFVNKNNKFSVSLRNAHGDTIVTLYKMENIPDPGHWQNITMEFITNEAFSIQFQVSTDSSSTYIAVDDISYRQGKCSEIINKTTLKP